MEMKTAAPDSLFGFLVVLLLLAPDDRSVVANQSQLGDLNISAILDAVLRGYDKRIRPNYGGSPVKVGVTMYILSISSVSEVQMDFTMDFYFRQFWMDNRLMFKARPGLDSLSVGAEMTEKLWVPDTFFANEKSAYFHTATTSNSFLRISPTGDVLRSIRLTVTASCPMNLQYFPMDRQLCTIEIESFGYTMQDIRYVWHKDDKSVGISPEVQLPQFRVLGHRQKSKEINLSTGNYSRLACEIQFVRSMGYYLIQIYIPSSLIVIISWVSFWLNRNASPARVALGVTTVLTMTTLMSSTNAALPKISYVKSIDVYLGTCFVMVFAALLEYATVGYLAKHIQMRKNRTLALHRLAEQRKAQDTSNHTGMPPEASIASSEQTGLPTPRQTCVELLQCAQEEGELMHSPSYRTVALEVADMVSIEVRFKINDPRAHMKGGVVLENTVGGPSGAEIELGLSRDLNKLYGISPSDIDKYSRVVFPVCFVCFNLMYWIIYLHISDVLVEDIVPISTE